MWRRLVRSVLAALVACAAFQHLGYASGEIMPPLVERFLAMDGPPPVQYRALRHLEAQNAHFDTSAWMDVWTEMGDDGAFRYEVVSEGGSEYIRKHVFLATLNAERKLWPSNSDASAFTTANYLFEDRGMQPDGLASIVVKPRRKDILLVDGSIFLRPQDGDLVRLEGRLAKPPSFWTRRVEIVRRFQRLGGARMPVALESVANVLIAGRSTFRMTYDYETVNHQRVGTPQLSPLISAR